MKVFISGATGFIGSYVTPLLVEAGHSPVCLVWEKELDRLPDLSKHMNADLVIGDINEPVSYIEELRSCDALIHLAGLYTTWEPDSSIYTKINVDGTRSIMGAALVAGVSKTINVSTYAVWGGAKEYPFNEESLPGNRLTSEYARTKYLGELEAWKLHKERGLPLVTIYPCNVMGAGDTRPSGSYLRNVIEQRLPARVLEDSVLTYVHVRDLALAILRALEKPGNIGEKYIIGKEILAVSEINHLIATCGGVRLPVFKMPESVAVIAAAGLTAVADIIKRSPPWGMTRDQIASMRQGLAADGTKAERELGIRYTPVCQAIEESVQWYRSQNGGEKRTS